MQTPVTLSIVMPVFNHPEELKTMIDSILANVFKEWELLAVDDGSQTETLQLLESYTQHDERIRFIRRDRTPKGAPTCRNMGLEQARGKYVVFFDSDDYVAPHCFEQRVGEMEKHPDLDFMVFRSGTYAEARFCADLGNFSFGYPIYTDDLEAFCSRTLPFVVWNNIYRRDSLIAHDIAWDERLLSFQDSQFNVDCLLADMTYAYAECPPDYGYRIATEQSISKKIPSAGHYESNLYATERSFRKVQAMYGHRYDHALYRGAMHIYTTVVRTHFDRDFSCRLAATVRSFAPCWGGWMKVQVVLSDVLRRFLPYTLSRRIPSIGYLMWYRRYWKSKVGRLHKCILKR